MKKISGVGKRHILKNFFKRINTPYNLRIRNAIDGEEMLHLALTKKSIYLLVSTLLVGSFLLMSLLFLFTPIKYYIPGYETNASRKKLIELNAKIEDISRYQKNYNSLINNVENVAMDNEAYLLDTASLSTAQLSNAEISNESQINSSRGKQRIIGKRRVDTTGRSPKTIVGRSEKVQTTTAETQSEIKKSKPKKRDTIITYK